MFKTVAALRRFHLFSRKTCKITLLSISRTACFAICFSETVPSTETFKGVIDGRFKVRSAATGSSPPKIA